ncbi:hypothetical protein AB0896_30930 [Streptomyces parvulus]|uniref:hypothetical protein n=1 Tax=Streptomyces parvulus TaxID=146923 RepID=UPI0034562E9F
MNAPSAGRNSPAPYLVRVTPDGNAPDLLELSFDGETHRLATSSNSWRTTRR